MLLRPGRAPPSSSRCGPQGQRAECRARAGRGRGFASVLSRARRLRLAELPSASWVLRPTEHRAHDIGRPPSARKNGHRVVSRCGADGETALQNQLNFQTETAAGSLELNFQTLASYLEECAGGRGR